MKPCLSRLLGIRISYLLIVLMAVSLGLYVLSYAIVYGSILLGWASNKFDFASDFNFRYIRDNGNSILIYSAYRDRRVSDIIRIVAVGRILPKPKLTCNWMTRRQHSRITPTDAVISQILTHKIQYDGFFIDCRLPDSKRSIFVGLSLEDKSSNLSIYTVPVYEIPAAKPKEATLAACVCPIFSNELDEQNLIAWIEMNRLLGVQRFVFYNYSAPTRLDSLFKYYTKRNVIELLDWGLNHIPTAEIGKWPPPSNKLPYYGQFAANNECLYRMMYRRYRYVMFSDLDELMVPSTPNQTLVELLRRTGNESSPAFVFRNSYVSPDVVEKDESPIKFIRHALREARVLPPDIGQKIIVQPRLVSKIGVHDLISKISGRERILGPSEALLLHYRSAPSYLKLKSDPGIRDIRVLAYKRRLLRNIKIVEEMLETYRTGR